VFEVSFAEVGNASSKDVSLEADILFVCDEVLNILYRRIPKGPALGYKRILLVQDSTPRACIDGLPKEYIVCLTCLDDRLYNQLVYQFAHELAHVYISPYISQPFVEILAVAVSLVVLKEMHDLWNQDAKLQSYAKHFKQYRDKVVQIAFDSLHIDLDSTSLTEEILSSTIHDWVVRCLVPRTLKEDDRSHQIVASLLIANVLETSSSWNALIYFQAAVSQSLSPSLFRLPRAWKRETTMYATLKQSNPSVGEWWSEFSGKAWFDRVRKSPNGEQDLVLSILSQFVRSTAELNL